MADRDTLLTRAADAVGHARRDHGGDLRRRGHACAGHARARAARIDRAPEPPVGDAAREGRGAGEPAQRKAGRRPAAAARRARRADLCGDREATHRKRRAHRHPLAAAGRARRGRRGDDGRRVARRAADARARRPRDDGELAVVGVRAAAAHAARVRPLARRSARRRGRRGCGLRRGDDPRDDAQPPGRADHRPPCEGTVADGRLPPAGRVARADLDRAAAPPRGRLPRPVRLSGPSASSA